MLKPTIIRGLEGHCLRERLPYAAKHLVRGTELADTILDLALFPYASSKIVTSAAIVKMLTKIGPSQNQLVVVGWDFTIEAMALLSSVKAIVLANRIFGWSDERWFSIRQA